MNVVSNSVGDVSAGDGVQVKEKGKVNKEGALSTRVAASIPPTDSDGPFMPVKNKKQRNGRSIASLEGPQLDGQAALLEVEAGKRILANPGEANAKGPKGQGGSSILENERSKGLSLPNRS